MKKRILSLLVGGAVAVGATAGLTACGGDSGLTVWAPNNQQTLVRELVEDFKKENPDITLEIKVGICGENEAYAQLAKDVKAGADVYGYANNQITDLYQGGAIAQLSADTVAMLKERDDEKSVESGMLMRGETAAYYGYPYAADNSFFLYYNKTLFEGQEDKVNTLEGILEVCAQKRKYFLFNMNDQPSWYLGSFFYAAGGEYNAEYDGATLISASSNFGEKAEGSEYSYGEIAINALNTLRGNPRFITCNDTIISTYLSDNRLGACVSGTWNAALMQEKLGEGYAVAKLPTYHGIDGKDYQLKPFMGYKLMGVNRYSKHLSEAHKLAAYLTGEKAQQKRFELLGIGPSNKVVAAKPEVKENAALYAIQSQSSFSVIQKPLPQSYWSAFDALGSDIYAGEGKMSESDLKTKLNSLISSLKEEG